MNSVDPYRKKWVFLILSISGGLVLCYLLAFSRTLDLYKQHKTQKEIEAINKAKPAEILRLQKEIEANEKLLSQKTGTDSIAPRQIVINLLSKASQQNRFTVKEVSPTYLNSNDSANSEITAYTLEGAYHELMKTWFYLEQNLKSGTIRSIHFIVKEDFRTHIKNLNMTLYVELLKKKD